MLQVEHSAILSTFIQLPIVIKIFVLSTFGRQFYTGSTVLVKFLSVSTIYNFSSFFLFFLAGSQQSVEVLLFGELGIETIWTPCSFRLNHRDLFWICFDDGIILGRGCVYIFQKAIFEGHGWEY